MSSTTNVLCIGAGYVGGPTMAVIADAAPQLRVIVIDINDDRIAAWNSDKLPIYEPGLDEVVRGRAAGTCSSRPSGRRHPPADIIFVSVNTPTKTLRAGRRARRRLAVLGEDRPPDPGKLRPRQDRRREEHPAGAHGRGDGAHPQLATRRAALRGALEPRIPRRRHAPSRIWRAPTAC